MLFKYLFIIISPCSPRCRRPSLRCCSTFRRSCRRRRRTRSTLDGGEGSSPWGASCRRGSGTGTWRNAPKIPEVIYLDKCLIKIKKYFPRPIAVDFNRRNALMGKTRTTTIKVTFFYVCKLRNEIDSKHQTSTRIRNPPILKLFFSFLGILSFNHSQLTSLSSEQ